MQWRYATKVYNPDETIPEQSIRDVQEILRLTPSGMNGQPWRFYFIQDKNLKAELAEFSGYNGRKIKQAPLLIVFCALHDVDALGEFIKSDLPEGPNYVFEKAKGQFSEQEIQEWMIRQVYISLGVAVSACAAMQLDATPMEGIEFEKYQQHLNTGSYQPVVALCVGYRAKDDYDAPGKKQKLRKKLTDIIVEYPNIDA